MRQSRKILPTVGFYRSSLEDLPNELFLEIFIYLLPEHLFKSFGNLNRRFCALIRSVFLHFRMTNDNIHSLSVIATNQIRSMMLDDLMTSSFQISMDYCKRNYFTHLQRLDFTFINLESLYSFLEVIPKLDKLEYLSIHGQNAFICEQSKTIYQIIVELQFTLPSLTHLKYIDICIPDMMPYYEYMLVPNPLSMLEYFSIGSICLDDLAIILTWMPQLKFIKIIYAFIVNGDGIHLYEHDLTSRSLMKMPPITSLLQVTIGLCDGVTSKHMEFLLNKLPELRRLECIFWSTHALDIDIWMQIFLRSKIDYLRFDLINKSIDGYLAHDLKADIWHRQIFKAAVLKNTNGGFSFEACGLNESRIIAEKALDDQSLNERQSKKQRTN